MRQLSLFKGKRQRGVASPPPLEFAIHATLADICKRWINPRWKFTHLPLGEHREHRINPRTGRRYSLSGQRLQRMGVMPGWPDFIFVGPNAQVFWLELKRFKKGRLSEDQSDVLAHLVACGFAVLVTTSLDDAVATLKQAGILRSNFEVQ
ncbi:hypothetical protein BRDID11004_59760 [Bradyrhizobium diazoefficiens]|uniref:VRR-NUC domain-containing protein n=1 Tax=Bradyrhizobium diazoefficiens TaxID=1355477 RepID=A0A810A194_9BRAD|nr:hypothetical protein [Bradyrhizobium diazoefficiens]BBZ93125.1 hypothetical protein F07S3_29580 [Bradyrhizobium diazoefficiens]BCA10876.1 hypothetical protein BDHF08_27230 [Bradyrhizobium diazoefficiens]BCE55211.1 hypothetical protein XF5B_27230 [Bradyrhizobium diazoefficiens]BCE63945.1 hypothetical protein XF6B_27440 [Bradyrhizobium diazoefficiens]